MTGSLIMSISCWLVSSFPFWAFSRSSDRLGVLLGSHHHKEHLQDFIVTDFPALRSLRQIAVVMRSAGVRTASSTNGQLNKRPRMIVPCAGSQAVSVHAQSTCSNKEGSNMTASVTTIAVDSASCVSRSLHRLYVQ